MNFKPRYYQTDAVQDTCTYLEKHPKNHPLIVGPPGAGKSYILAMLSTLFKGRILVVSHVKEILEQDLSKLEELLEEPVGVYSAGMKRREHINRVTVAGVQSVYRNAELFKDVRYVIVDEAHKIPKSGDGMYRQLFQTLGECTVVGLTATPYRLGSGYLHKGKNKLFDDISYEVDIVRLIKEGFLSPLLTKNANVVLDTKKLKVKAGDFSEKDMARRFDKFSTTNAIVEELTTYRQLYKHWLLFAISIEHAIHLRDALSSAGIATAAVHSQQSIAENEYAIWAYQHGVIQCLISIEKMTTGFDSPHTDLIAIVRPTQSPVVHVQMIGRGLRIDISSDHCLILDFAGNLDRLGPINEVYIKEPGKKGTGEAPIKACPECNTHVPAGANKCYVCGYEFPKKESSHLSSVATSSQAVQTKSSSASHGKWLTVSSVVYIYYTGKKGTSLQVRYSCGLRTVSEWFAFGRKGFGGKIAANWWNKHTLWKQHPEYKIPKWSKQAAIRATKGELREPKRIYVETERGYSKIKSRLY